MSARGLLALLAPLVLAAAPAHAAGEEEGRALFEDKCAQCHGSEGDGAGVAAERLLPRPRDFTSGSFKIRTTASGELPTDSDLAAVIRKGMPYTAMPAWPSLSDAQVDALIAHVKGLNEDFADPDMIVPPVEIPDPPALSEDSVRAGRQVYADNKCGDCHGELGRGNGPSGPTLKTDTGIPIRPADLTHRWTFRGGASRRDIYRTFTTGLDGTPMPSYADSIGEQQRWQLVDYVYSLSRDEPAYGSLVVAARAAAPIGAEPDAALFDATEPVRLATVGQVTDPGRQFTPATNAVEVRAVWDDESIAFEVSWHAMAAYRDGGNRPDGREPAAPDEPLSDAVAVQLPAQPGTGPARPYLLYGDAAKAVDLWFWEASQDAVRVYRGNGESNLVPHADSGAVRARGRYQDGRWSVVFVTPRGDRFPESTFVPLAFSVWAGHAGETGNRRAITGWYPVYLKPPEGGAAWATAGGLFVFTLIAELLVAAGVRRSQSAGTPQT